MVLSGALNQMLDSIAAAERQVAEQQAREEQLQARLRQSQQLAAVGRLAAGVAHELGSPLSVIDGKAQRVLRDEELAEAHRRALLQIRQQVARLSAIVRQLLDFGRAAGSPRAVCRPRCWRIRPLRRWPTSWPRSKSACSRRRRRHCIAGSTRRVSSRR